MSTPILQYGDYVQFLAAVRQHKCGTTWSVLTQQGNNYTISAKVQDDNLHFYRVQYSQGGSSLAAQITQLQQDLLLIGSNIHYVGAGLDCVLKLSYALYQ